MNFLQLCQKVRERAGASGSGPTAVTAQTGEYGRIVNWVKDSWNEIQAERTDWPWMWGTFSHTLPAGVTDTDFGITGRPVDHTVKADTGAALEERPYVPGSITTSEVGTPSRYICLPSGVYRLMPTPESDTPVTGEYYADPSELSATTDVPGMDTKFHMLIVFRALMRYAEYENAQELYASAKREYDILHSDLIVKSFGLTFGAPLA